MYNVFKPTQKRKKPNLTKESIVNFLNGEYEKQASLSGKHIAGKTGKIIPKSAFNGKELQGIRAFETSYRKNDVDIIFCKDYREKYGARIIHKEGLKPFVWAKDPLSMMKAGFYKYDIVVVDEKQVDKKFVLINDDLKALDGENARILKTVEGDDGSIKYWVRYRPKNYTEWKQIVDRKQKLYGIQSEDQIKSFEKKIVDRMNTGFSQKITIQPSDGKKYSKNPYYNHFRYNKIVGSFNNLLDFYREGGIAPRGTLYLDEKKLKNWFNFLSDDIEAISRFYINLYRWKSIFFPFKKGSCDFSKIIDVYQKIYPKIAYKIDIHYINKEISENASKVIDKLLDFGCNLEDIFNVRLDENKIIKYIVEPYTFDQSRNSKDLIDFLDAKGINLYKVKEQKLFFVNPLEQYMIQTGRRLFKGVENYEDLDILTLDIETKEQEGNEHIDVAALKPELGRVFQVGIGSNRGYKEFLHAREESEEQGVLERSYEVIGEYDPDILLTYNGEGFDFPFMEKRMELLGCVKEEYNGDETSTEYIREILKPYYDEYGEVFSFYNYRRNEGAILKVGNGTEDYTQTKMYGKNICDVMFAVKRAAAIDPEIPNNKLKDNIIHANLAAKNRVYVPGDKIGFYEKDQRAYYLNRKNGDYFLAEKSIDFNIQSFDADKVKEGEDGKFYENKKFLYFYTDDGSQPLEFLNDCTNAFGIKIHNNGKLYADKDLSIIRESIDRQFLGFYQHVLPYEGIRCPNIGIAQQLNKIGSKDTFKYIEDKLKLIRANFEDISNIYNLFENIEVDWDNIDKVSGSEIVEEYLRGDIEEPYLLDQLYSQATFEIAKWLPTKYEKIAVMGNANVWKLLLATWSYLNAITIPDYEDDKNFTGGLLGMVESGFHKNIVKIDYSSLYPAEFLKHVKIPDIDITQVYKMFVGYGLDTRLYYKKMKNNAKATIDRLLDQINNIKQNDKYTDKEKNQKIAKIKLKFDKAKADKQLFDKKQLPLKILINSFYGMLGAAKVSPFAHIDSAWHITCSGRQHMRHLIRYFEPLGFKIIYFHTDGANFVIPDGVDDYEYIGKGENWLVEKGVKYTGVEAYVAEYNDLFMKGRMGVDIDEYAISCINFSKGNFTYLKEKDGEKVISHVGGTLDKKNQNKYISEFFDNNLETILMGNASEFLDAYYEYVKKIYNQDIIAGKIANKNRVTKDLDDYIRGVKEGKYNKQAHLELAIEAGIEIEKGDWLYTINVGDGKKETGDLQTINDSMGYFVFETKAKCEAAIKKLQAKGDDYEFIKSSMLKCEKNNQFIFRRKKVSKVVVDLFGESNKSELVSKRGFIDEITDTEKVEFKYKKKVNSKGDITHTVEVIYKYRNLNAKLIEKEELDAKIEYNAIAYINKFNKALKNIWIVFHPEIRDKIPTPNRAIKTGESTDRKANQRAYFTDEELELVSGYPLEGKEDKQQDLEDLLIVTDEEMDFWISMGMSPNNSFDYQNIDIDGTYYVSDDNTVSLEPSSINDVKMSGFELAHWLKDFVILDYDNPPYKFAC